MTSPLPATEPAASPAPATLPPLALSLRHLTFRHRTATRPTLDDISIDLPRGTLLAILGATGAGKSTLCHTLNGLVPTLFHGDMRGEIEIESVPPIRYPSPANTRPPGVGELSRKVAVVFQDFESQLFTTDVELEVAFGPESFGVPRAEIVERVARALSQVGLTGFEGRSPLELSGGEKQRLAIAAALAVEPRVLVLDEPTTDLDPVGKEGVLRVLADLRAEGRTIVLVEHETEALASADRVVALDGGRVALSGGREILAESDALEALGVRPPELPRLFRRLGLDPKAAPIADAQAAARTLTDAGFSLDRAAYDACVAAERPAPAGPPLLEARDLHHTYPGRPRPSLDGVSIAIGRGEFLAILGGNGSGKSTLARHLCGLLPAREGAILLDGKPISGLSRAMIARQVGFIFQNPDHQIFSATVRDEVAFGPRNFGLPRDEIDRRVAAALETVGLSGREREDPFGMTKGDRQRLAVASVLALDPPVLLMDEPTTGLDHRDQRRMMELLARTNADGRTVVVITHHIWIAAEYARRVALLSSGAIVRDGLAREVLADEAALAKARVVAPPISRLAGLMGGPEGASFRTGEESARCLRREKEGEQ